MTYVGNPQFPEQNLTSIRRMRESAKGQDHCPTCGSVLTPGQECEKCGAMPAKEHGVSGMKWHQQKQAFKDPKVAGEALHQHGFVQTSQPGIHRNLNGDMMKLRPHNQAGQGNTPHTAMVAEPHKEEKESRESNSRYLANGKKKPLAQRQREGFYPEIR